MPGLVALRMRKPREWYVDCRFELGGNCMLRGLMGGGETPEAAVEALWSEICDVPHGRWLTTDGGQTKIKWNGYMWRVG